MTKQKEWPYISRLEFEKMRDANPYEWQRTTGKTTKLYKKYSMYWSSKYGGLWVAEP